VPFVFTVGRGRNVASFSSLKKWIGKKRREVSLVAYIFTFAKKKGASTIITKRKGGYKGDPPFKSSTDTYLELLSVNGKRGDEALDTTPPKES